MALIPLTQGFRAIVDDADLPLLSKYKWRAVKTGSGYWYAATGDKTMYMHRLLLPVTELIDHINGDGLDNRRENLRATTRSINKANSRESKGIYFQNGTWYGQVQKDGKKFRKGFPNKQDAIAWREQMFHELFGKIR